MTVAKFRHLLVWFGRILSLAGLACVVTPGHPILFGTIGWLITMCAATILVCGKLASDIDIRRIAGLGPPRRPDVTPAGIEGAVLRCPGVVRVLTTNGVEPWTFIQVWGGEETAVREAVDEHKPVGVQAIVEVRGALER